MNSQTSPTLQAIYKEALGDYGGYKEFLWMHRGRFVHYVQRAIDAGLLEPTYSRKHFKLEKLSYSLDPSRDSLLNATEIAKLANYLLKDTSGKIVETPQYYWMRIAMTRSINTENPTRSALVLYDELSLKPEASS